MDKPKLSNLELKSSSSYIWALVIGIIGFLLYLNTVGNEYVLDDNYAIARNQFVQEGISSIPKIMTVDFWYFTNLKLGYYRPLSLITFAIENQFFGNNPHVSHFDNALLYGLSGFLLCFFLLQFMPKRHPAFAFLISLIFMAHPIHTEVVANIKSRDEILSFLNLMAMMVFVFRYKNGKQRKDLIWSFVFFYLALLSKETAIVGLAFPPVFLYYVGVKIPEIIKKLLPYAGIAIFFFLQKRYFLGNTPPQTTDDMINYPYAAHLVKLPSVFHIFLVCLQRLVLPWPLSYDYSYNQIPPSHWSDLGAVIGLLLFIGLGIFTVRELYNKSLWGLGLAFVFITIAPSLGFVFLRGGIMAERFLYAPCLGFAILLVYALSLASEKIKESHIDLAGWLKKNKPLAAVVLILCIAYSIETVGRNKAWHDQLSLFSSDVKHSPNSCQVHKHYATAVLENGRNEKDSSKRKEDFMIGMRELNKADSILPNTDDVLYRKGYAYQFVEINLDSAIKYYKASIGASTAYAAAYNDLAAVYFLLGKNKLASYYFNRAVEINPTLTEAINNAAYIKKITGEDVHVFPGEDSVIVQKPVQNQANAVPQAVVDEFNNDIKRGGESVQKGDFASAIKYFKKATAIQPDNEQTLIYLANSYGMAKRYKDAIKTFELILKHNPNNQIVIKNLALTYDAIGQKAKGDELRKQLK